MRKLLLLAAICASMVLAQTQTFTYTYSGLPIPIYPDDWNTVSTISIMVPKNMAVSKVTASVSVQYSGLGDLNVFLWSAAGTRSKLLERNCGGAVNINTTFDDAAPSMYKDACPSASSPTTHRGNEPLSNSRNENAFGYWRLGVENNGSSRTGLVTGFTISISGTVLSPPAIGTNTVVSTASLEGGTVAPGDQITIIGVNLGPAEGIRADATKNLPTSLGGTSVLFDGVAAPIYYVSDGFVQVQAPAALTSATNTRIQVNASTGASAVVALPVLSSKPGILTYESVGKGQAKVLNQDGSVNGDGSITGSDHAASAGSVIQVFATGLGPLNPTIPDGAPAPSSPLSWAALPVAATVGGRAATVAYAGAAPGMVGVYQVNIVVPVLAPSGAARLVLSVDGNNSQNGVTVQIR